MKLLYIQNAKIPTEKAHGIQIMKMCEAFALENVDIELILPRRRNSINQDPFEYYGVRRNFKIKKLPCLDLIPLDKYIGRLGLWIESFTFFIFALFYVLFKKADAIYTKKSLILPLVFFKKNVFFEAHIFTKNYSLYSPVFRKLKGIIAITKNLKNSFLEKGIQDNKILVAPDGVDLEKFDIPDTQEDCRKRLNLPLDKKIVLYTGHLYKWKGPQVLAEASQYLPKDVEVYFVGGTEEDVKKFELRTSNFELNIIGHRPYSEMPYWLKAADVLVLPNTAKEEISKYWTSPLKLFEYMASKRPIVASDLPSVREILNEDNSVLAKPDDSKSLAGGIEKVLEDKNLAEKISTRAFENVKQYTWARRAKKILKFIVAQ